MNELKMIKVLDHGFVRLVDHMGSDLSVVRAARVSFDAAWRAGEDGKSDINLIRYLFRNRHTSPFEAVEFSFEVKAPIFVFRQWHRHRTWSYNEVSARYTELPEEYYVPDPAKVGIQSLKNRQARVFAGQFDRGADVVTLREHHEQTFALYRSLLQDEWPRELARTVLPLATYSTMFAKVDLHNLLHFLTLRCDEHSQYEIRVYAEALRELIRPIVPITVSMWERYKFEWWDEQKHGPMSNHREWLDKL